MLDYELLPTDREPYLMVKPYLAPHIPRHSWASTAYPLIQWSLSSDYAGVVYNRTPVLVFLLQLHTYVVKVV